MKLKYLVIPATTFCLLFSGPIFAKKPEGKGNPHHGESDARWEKPPSTKPWWSLFDNE